MCGSIWLEGDFKTKIGLLNFISPPQSHRTVGSLWRESGLNWTDFLAEGEDIQAFISQQVANEASRSNRLISVNPRFPLRRLFLIVSRLSPRTQTETAAHPVGRRRPRGRSVQADLLSRRAQPAAGAAPAGGHGHRRADIRLGGGTTWWAWRPGRSGPSSNSRCSRTGCHHRFQCVFVRCQVASKQTLGLKSVMRSMSSACV